MAASLASVREPPCRSRGADSTLSSQWITGNWNTFTQLQMYQQRVVGQQQPGGFVWH